MIDLPFLIKILEPRTTRLNQSCAVATAHKRMRHKSEDSLLRTLTEVNKENFISINWNTLKYEEEKLKCYN